MIHILVDLATHLHDVAHPFAHGTDIRLTGTTLADSTPNENPFSGVVPNFNIFGVEFTQAWQKLLAGVWGLAFVIVAFGAIRAVIELQHAKKGGYQSSVLEHTESAKRSGLALGALAALGIIFGAVVALF